MKLFLILLLPSLVLDIPKLASQTDLRFEQLSVRDGLSHNTVKCILQDSEGFMWFGTKGGLNKYDGYTFKQFYPDPEDPRKSLHDNLIRDIYEDRQGRLCVSTTGLHLINKRTDEISVFLVDSTQFAYWNIGLSIHEDKNGYLWSNAGGALHKFDPDTERFTSYKTPELNPNHGLVEDESGIFWMGSGSKLLRFDPTGEKFTVVPFEQDTVNDIFISALLLDSDGLLWIGTDNAGIFQLDTKNRSAAIKRFNPGNMGNKKISESGLFEDRDGIIWVATSQSLQRIDREKGRIHTFTSDPSNPTSISSNNVLSVYQDRDEMLWVGTDNGINKAITSPASFHSHQVVSSPAYSRLDANKINSIVEDLDGKVWLGTEKGLYYLDIATRNTVYFPLHQGSLQSLSAPAPISRRPNIFAIRKDMAGRLWIGTETGLYFLNPREGSFSHFPCQIPVSMMAIDHLDNIWIPGGDNKSGNAVLAVFDTKRLQFTYTEYAVNDPTGLRDRYLHDVMASRNGDIYVAGGMWGIGRRDKDTGTFSHMLPNSRSPGSMVENDIWCLMKTQKVLFGQAQKWAA